MMKRFSVPELFLLLFLFSSYGVSQVGKDAQLPGTTASGIRPFPTEADSSDHSAFWQAPSPWADSVIATLSLEEKIGQLFMVAAYPGPGKDNATELENLVKQHHIGGLIFFRGDGGRQVALTNRLQKASNVPLFVGMDAEWGLHMRLEEAPGYPRQMTLGALENNELIYRMGRQIAEDCRRMGIHINFAPVADVNSNPDNPVINSRSFGEDVAWVSEKSLAYMRGLQDGGVMACAKHFPGHGDTDSDSHKTLPTLLHDKQRLQNVELKPFQALIDAGVGSAMVAHLHIPALDSTPNLPATLSAKVVTDLLRNEMDFRGLIFTDAMNMKGVADFFPAGESDLRALQAGNDVLLFPLDVPAAVEKIKTAVETGELDAAVISRRAHRILKAKERFGVGRFAELDTSNWQSDISGWGDQVLRREMAEQSVTVLKNELEQLPVNNRTGKKAGILVYGETPGDAFLDEFAQYNQATTYTLKGNDTKDERYRAFYFLSQYDQTVVVLTGSNNRVSRNFGLDEERIKFVQRLAKKNEVTLVWMGNPYALQQLQKAEDFESIVVAYQDDPLTQRALARALSGVVPIQGKLPVSVPGLWPAGTQVKIPGGLYLANGIPEEVGINASALYRLDSVALDAIAKKATPGCQVLVARDGKIVYNKAFGHFTYDGSQEISVESVYDLASLTKMLATTISVMKLYDEGKIDLRATLGNYLDFIPGDSPYAQIAIRDILTHSAGLASWIPFYKDYLKDEKRRKKTFRDKESAYFSVRVAEGMYAVDGIRDSVFQRILKEPLDPKKDYQYSDLGFYFLKEVIERLAGQAMEDYVREQFYAPMNALSLGYRPLSRFSTRQIVPTEYDADFRGVLVHGDVHDPGAAMLGGVSGHAGLFGRASDVARVMQMLLNKGVYGQRRYLQKGTVELFTRTQSTDPEKNRRGLGFDKPVWDDGPGPTFHGISLESYGHSGFTGTLAWADPVENIVYVFLSNRVYPTAANRKLIKMNVRSEMQRIIYESLKEVRHPDKKTYAEEP